jgi:hypothetical protein
MVRAVAAAAVCAAGAAAAAMAQQLAVLVFGSSGSISSSCRRDGAVAVGAATACAESRVAGRG